jgi:hypothetical protein
MLGVAYMEALFREDQRLAEFLSSRFRPEMKRAVDAWLTTDPVHNPDAPRSPFKMAEYSQQELIDAKRQEELSAGYHAQAQQANETADRYVLLTVLFACVLFFGGIGGTFQSRRLQNIVFCLALILFAITVFSLAALPVCSD